MACSLRYETLEVNEEDGGRIIVCTLNRPKYLNALSLQMLKDLSDFFTFLETSECKGRVLLLKGSGRAFCSGADLIESASGHDFQRQEKFSNVLLKLAKCSLPVIALVKGAAAGGGFSLSLACDVRVCTKDAYFCASFLSLGLSGCELGSSYFLPRCVGLSHAAEVLMTGDKVTAESAERMGLVSHVLETEELMLAKGFEIARKMCAASRIGLTLTKKQLRMSVDAGSVESVVHSEDKTQILCFGDPECQQMLGSVASRFAKL